MRISPWHRLGGRSIAVVWRILAVVLAVVVPLALGSCQKANPRSDADARSLGDTSASSVQNARGSAGAVTPIALGVSFGCALLGDGRVRCWGANDEGQLGDGSQVPRLGPTTVPGLEGVAEIGAASNHACARLRDGTVRCWGSGAWSGRRDGGK